MFGTGGDEINTNCYQKDPSTQEDLKLSGETLEQALDSFTQSTHGALRQLGKKVVVWQGGLYLIALVALADSYIFCVEMALEHQVSLAKDTIVMYAIISILVLSIQLIKIPRVWISSKHAAKVAKKGFRVVHAPSDYFYLVN